MINKKVAGLVLAVGLLGGVVGNAVAPREEVKYIDGTASALQWQLNSGEVVALQYQAYNNAERQLESMVKEYKGDKPLAVVLDLDETVINNYGSSINDLVTRQGFSQERFTEWSLKEEATIISGADDFLKKADELGVEIFYITNRVPEEINATINNLHKLGLPETDAEHILVKEDSSNKSKRVAKVSETHNIAMFIGDNLGDFPSDFYKKSNKERQDLVVENEDKFGTEYIILPNASYGDWDGATFGYNYSKTDEQKIADRLDAISNYNK